MQGGDEIGLRLHHFRTVDLEQRIAALDVVTPILASTRVTRPENGVCTMVLASSLKAI
jgi:hypothetical protein